MADIPKFKSQTPRNAAHAYAALNGGEVRKVSRTGSMRPFINDDDYVVIAKPKYEEIQKGDILLYSGKISKAAKDRTVGLLHRAAMKDRLGWIMGGDNNSAYENWDRVTPDLLMGKAVAVFTVGEPE